MHWDGKAWSVVLTPNVPDRSNMLRAVAAISPSDVWAIGWVGGSGSVEDIGSLLTMHWDGKAWSIVPNPGYGFFGAIAAVSSTDVWTVGSNRAAKGDNHAQVLHWDGKAWRDPTDQAFGGWDRASDVVATSASDVWVAGTSVLHWNGKQWETKTPPASLLELSGVAASGPNDVWAVGMGVVRNKTIVIHWDGSKWTELPVPDLGYNSKIALAPGGPNSQPWISGSQGPLVRWDGAGWLPVALPLTARHTYISSPRSVGGDLWFAAATSDLPNDASPRRGYILKYDRSCAIAAPSSATSTVTPEFTPGPVPGSNSRIFPQTGKTVNGLFLDYWQQHGGLAQNGYPISNRFTEISDLNGKPYAVQYFERAVFEYHPENQAPFNVLLSQLGTFQYHRKYPNGAPGQHPYTAPGSALFPETGKRVGGRFLQYWKDHGGLIQQGYPISDEFTETSDLNGKQYLAQYFERAVFEYHPENAPPYDVLLSQLGTFRYKAKYGGK